VRIIIPQGEILEPVVINRRGLTQDFKARQGPGLPCELLPHLRQVVAVNVGNEALVDWNDHLVEVDTVIAYVRKVKSSIPQQVTVADNYEWWAAKGQKLARIVDLYGDEMDAILSPFENGIVLAIRGNVVHPGESPVTVGRIIPRADLE